MQITYLQCRNKIMTYVDPKSHFKIPRSTIVRYEGKLTKTMQTWIRRGGLKVVEEALYLEQQKMEPKVKKEIVPTETVSTEAVSTETPNETTDEKKDDPKLSSDEKPKEKRPRRSPPRRSRKQQPEVST